MRGKESSNAQEPVLEKSVREVGDDIIRSLVDTEGFVAWKERWPNAAKYAACLTHDVDSVSRPISQVLERRSRFSTFDLLLAVAGLRDLYDNIAYVARMEEERSLRSSFYLLSGGYDLRPKAAQLTSIQEGGWEVGLHGDFGTHDSAEKMLEAVARIKAATGTSPVGVREHYLRFDFGSTWEIMEKAGFLYDSTVGNTDRIGFRMGLCNPFHPPDNNWKPLKLLEMPLGLMDVTLWGYLKRTEAEGARDFEALKRSVEEVNGLFTLLWHPEGARMKGGRIYPALLDSLLKDGCFVGSGIALADWWTKRSSSLYREGKTFRMDAAPKGLVLKFKGRGAQEAEAVGGAVSREGDATAITAAGGPLKVTMR